MVASAPVGPVALMCIRRSLERGRLYGFIAGIGAATADTLYATVAAFGLVMISNFVVEQVRWIQWGGGLLLVMFGVLMIFARAPVSGRKPPGNHFSSFGKAFVITLANPAAFIAFTAIFAAFGFVDINENTPEAFLLIAGVLTGALLWWFGLCSASSRFRKRVQLPDVNTIKRIEGIILLLFGLVALLGLF
jgi:threonine/homoserine/homoserine lactone efflux protein